MAENLNTPANILEQQAQAAQLKPELVAVAKAQWEKLRAMREHGTAQELASLQEEIQGENLTEDDKNRIRHVIVGTERRMVEEGFMAELKKENTDFEGTDDRGNVQEHAGEAHRIMREVLAGTTESTPLHYQVEWMQAVKNYFKQEIAAYYNSPGVMTVADIQALEKSVLDTQQKSPKAQLPGVGSFEDWFSTNHKEAYEAWRTAEIQKQDAAEQVKQHAVNAAAETEAAKKTAEEQAALEAQKKLEVESSAKKSAEETEVSRAAAAIEAADKKDASWFDQIMNPADQMSQIPMGRNIKKTFLGIFMPIISALAGFSFIKHWMVKSNIISYKALAESFKDKEAEVALKAEGEFKKFGLPRRMADNLGTETVGDVITQIDGAPDDITKDENFQARLAQLSAELKAKGGEGKEITLFEFMGNNPEWTGIAYKTPMPTVAAAAAPAAPASSAPTVAAAPNPEEKTPAA